MAGGSHAAGVIAVDGISDTTGIEVGSKHRLFPGWGGGGGGGGGGVLGSGVDWVAGGESFVFWLVGGWGGGGGGELAGGGFILVVFVVEDTV